MLLADLDFAEGAPVKKLTIAGGKVYAGNDAPRFETAEPLALTPANDYPTNALLSLDECVQKYRQHS